MIDTFRDFLTNFYNDHPSGRGGKEFKYAKRLQQLAHREVVDIVVDLDDLESYPGGKDMEQLVESIENNTKR